MVDPNARGVVEQEAVILFQAMLLPYRVHLSRS